MSQRFDQLLGHSSYSMGGKIIQEGSGTDFDPILVEVFLDIREKVEAVHDSINE